MVTNYEGEGIGLKETIPLLPIRDIVVYPFMIQPLYVGRESSIKAIEEAFHNSNKLIFLVGQKDIQTENPRPDEIYNLGTISNIVRLRKLPDGRLKILIQGLTKARILNYEHSEPFHKVTVQKIESVEVTEGLEAVEAHMRTVRESLELIINKGKVLSPDILIILEEIKDPSRFADIVSANLNLKPEQAQEILETLDPVDRLVKLNEILARELKIISYQNEIKSSTTSEISKTQKEYFLREQIKQMKNELSDENVPEDEFGDIKNQILEKKMPKNVEKESLKQLARLEKMHPDSTESSTLRTYLEWMCDLPWHEESTEITDLEYAMSVLDKDHFDLKEIKERIMEHLAVRTLKGGKVRGPILCFSGPPGVGKTSLGKSIARATGREFVRISLGGVKDESEIRGHRRTYVGAMPGRFIQAMKQAKTKNPIILLDEIDKLGSDYKGDPSSALLEVLDPSQNSDFRDHYLNVGYDLSDVMFLATANVLQNIPGPLRDRMEVINLSGYSQEEKLEISKQYLIPKQMDENGITKDHVKFHDEGVISVIDGFTREAGLRNLERQIGSLCRKVAKKIATGGSGQTHILSKTVEKMLGPAQFSREAGSDIDEIGVATGLAWTAVGGEILFIEATKMKGRGITLTGQLGDVMKESATAAFSYIRANCDKLGIDESVFEEFEVHIHLPAGAIPKDGPSAGITLATTIVSILTGTLISKDIAMTGEMTLTGKVLPIGGLKEKALAAMRVGIDTIIIPWGNQKDLAEIPEEYKKKLTFVPVKNIMEVLEVAILDWEPHLRQAFDNKTQKLNRRKADIAA